MKKKKKDIDTSQERIPKKEKKNLNKHKNESESESESKSISNSISISNSQYSSSHETDRGSDKESDRESGKNIDKKGVRKNSHSTSSAENDSHQSELQKSIKLKKKKKNARKKSSNSETSEAEEKSVKGGTNESEEEEEKYKSNRHKKKSKISNEKKKKLSNSEGSESDSINYKKEKKKDRTKLKRGRSSSSDSSYTRGSHGNEKKHFKNKKHNKRRDMKRSVSNSSNDFKKKRKKDKNDYHSRDQIKNKKRSSSISSSSYERKKKYSDSLEDSSDYGHKMKREKHNARWKRDRYKQKHRRHSSSSSSDLSRGRDRSRRYKKRENERNKYSEEKEYDPFDEDLNKDVEINENLIEYAKKKIANVTTEDIGRTGGIYIPPFKLERLQNEIKNKKSSAYQKSEWMKLKKKINNIVNKVNIDNIGEICYELFECNLIRGKGIFSRAILHAQLSSPAFTNVFTCLLCIVNSKFPNIGLLTIHRTILHFRRAYKRCDKIACFNSVKFIAHMINQRVLNEIVGLQLCSLLLQNITNDSVQVCTYFLAEVGQLYMNICRSGLDIIFDRLKDIIQEGNINVKTQYDIEKLWNYRKNYFKDFPTVVEDLDIIGEDDKIVHEIDLLDETINNQEELNIFREVPYEQYEKEDQEWADISRELLDDDDNSRSKRKNKKGSDSDGSSDSSKSESYTDDSSTDSENDSNSGNNNTSDESNDEEDDNKEEIHDMTEQYLINLRKNIYLSIMSSLSFEECVHKLLKLTIKSGYEIEICNMLIDCCCMEKTFQKFYALQAERLCKLKTIYQENFEKCFENSYNTAHRLETAKLRNCSKFFAHLLYTDAISWRVFTLIKLTEEDTTSSTRIFIKILLQELTNNMGIKTFYFKINHPAISPFLSGLFPSNNSQNIRFSINFFTAIGLGALTSSMRKLLSAEGQ